jgi:hypothetical protein
MWITNDKNSGRGNKERSERSQELVEHGVGVEQDERMFR